MPPGTLRIKTQLLNFLKFLCTFFLKEETNQSCSIDKNDVDLYSGSEFPSFSIPYSESR